MMKLVSAAGILALAAGAQAASFQLVSVETGGGGTALGQLPGTTGAGFTVSGGIFSNTNGTLLPNSAATFSLANQNELDSYYSLDAIGPSHKGGTAAAGGSILTRTFYGVGAGSYATSSTTYNSGPASAFAPGSHLGFVNPDATAPPMTKNITRASYGRTPGSAPGFTSGKAPNMTGGRSAEDGMFLARFTVTAGATISGGADVNVLTGPGVSQTARVELTLGTGPSILTFVNPLTGLPTNPINQPAGVGYWLKAYKVGSVTINNTNQNDDPNDPNATFPPLGAADVYDIWFQTCPIPTPGTLGLCGLGGLALLRRRRA